MVWWGDAGVAKGGDECGGIASGRGGGADGAVVQEVPTLYKP